MWEISNTDQIATVLYSFVLGITSCLFYDIFRGIRKNFKCKNAAVFVQDLIYFIISAFFFFLFFFVRTNGEIRGYILAFALSGVIFCRATLSKIWFRITSFAMKSLKKAVDFFRKKTDLFCIFALKIFSELKRIIKSFGKKTKNA